MIALLAVDPGIVSGWAWFFQGKLDRCGVVRTSRDTGWFPAVPSLPYVTDLVIEVPQAYAPSKSKGDPQDLIWLAFLAGRWAQAVHAQNVRTPLPREWKGQVPKGIDAGRALRVLSPAERSAVTGADHNMLDAISLGLWALGRKP